MFAARKISINNKIYKMKHIKTLLVALGLFVASTGFAQSKAAPWAEMKAFHTLMAGTFHTAEEGDLKPLKEKAGDLNKAAEAWKASKVPADFKEKETTETLDKLVKQTAEIAEKVKAGASDKELTGLITAAHDTFHKVAGECRKGDDHEKHEGHGH